MTNNRLTDILTLLSWTISDYECRKEEIHDKTLMYLKTHDNTGKSINTLASEIRKTLRS